MSAAKFFGPTIKQFFSNLLACSLLTNELIALLIQVLLGKEYYKAMKIQGRQNVVALEPDWHLAPTEERKVGAYWLHVS